MADIWKECRVKNTVAVCEYIKKGRDVNAHSLEDGSTLLIAAADSAYLVGMLIEAGADVNAQNLTGETALNMAVYFNNVMVVRKLLEANADVAISDNILRDCAFAAEIGLKDQHTIQNIADLLMDNGADPAPWMFYVIRSDGKFQEQFDLCDRDVSATVDNFFDEVVYEQFQDRWTPFMEAMKYKNFDFAVDLIARGFETNMSEVDEILTRDSWTQDHDLLYEDFEERLHEIEKIQSAKRKNNLKMHLEKRIDELKDCHNFLRWKFSAECIGEEIFQFAFCGWVRNLESQLLD